jgi:hypothetical protein
MHDEARLARPGRSTPGGAMTRVLLFMAAAAVAAAMAAPLTGCARGSAGPVTVRVLGGIEAIDGTEGASIPADATILVRLQRDGTILDEVRIDPARSGPPYPFELLYDRTQAGGTGLLVVEVRREGRIVLGTPEGIPVQLDGAPVVLGCRLVPPRRSVGP